MITIDIIAAVISISGAYLIGNGDSKTMPIALFLYLIASFLWFYFSISNGIIGMVITSSAYIILETRALYKWSNLSKKDKKAVDKATDNLI